MRKLLNACALLAATSSMAIAPVAMAQTTAPERTNTYSGTLSALNGSGVTGTFTIEQKGQGQIRLSIQATGLEPTTQPHLGHIHGPEGGAKAMCPTLAQDADGDGFVELGEGLTTYGPIILDLGDVDPDHDGTVNYTMTFNLNQSKAFGEGKTKADLLPLENREIVLHGLTLDAGEGSNGGEADGTAGYKVVLPVACGAIMMNPR